MPRRRLPAHAQCGSAERGRHGAEVGARGGREAAGERRGRRRRGWRRSGGFPLDPGPPSVCPCRGERRPAGGEAGPGREACAGTRGAGGAARGIQTAGTGCGVSGPGGRSGGAPAPPTPCLVFLRGVRDTEGVSVGGVWDPPRVTGCPPGAADTRRGGVTAAGTVGKTREEKNPPFIPSGNGGRCLNQNSATGPAGV